MGTGRVSGPHSAAPRAHATESLPSSALAMCWLASVLDFSPPSAPVERPWRALGLDSDPEPITAHRVDAKAVLLDMQAPCVCQAVRLVTAQRWTEAQVRSRGLRVRAWQRLVTSLLSLNCVAPLSSHWDSRAQPLVLWSGLRGQREMGVTELMGKDGASGGAVLGTHGAEGAWSDLLLPGQPRSLEEEWLGGFSLPWFLRDALQAARALGGGRGVRHRVVLILHSGAALTSSQHVVPRATGLWPPPGLGN